MLQQVFAAKLESMQEEAAEDTKIRGANIEMELNVEDRHDQVVKGRSPPG